MAARPAAPAQSMEQFEAYFQKADLDRDGKITGQEAVAFFQGSNLSKNTLAQIWMHSDKNNVGYLGRPEFYNALRLVTVAQSGRELTREIVKAALEGPAAARIPPPKINIVAAPNPPANALFAQRPQTNTIMASSQMTLPLTPNQNVGSQGPNSDVLPKISINNQALPSLANQLVRQSTPASSSNTMQLTSQGNSGGIVPGRSLSSSGTPNLTTDWFRGRTNGKSEVTESSSREVTPSMTQGGLPQTLSGPTNFIQQPPVASVATSMPSQSLNFPVTSSSSQSDSKALVVSENGFLSESAFGGDAFVATQPKQDASSFTFPTTKMANSYSAGSLTTTSQLPVKPAKDDSLQSMSSMETGGNSIQKTQPTVKQGQLDAFPKTTTPASSTGSGGKEVPGYSLSQSQASQIPWPKMTPSNVQKYTKVFFEVDKDRDGKITGEEARNLFLSWRLPREVLKRVWDLSDQDGDSMLSLSEFCIALYLMERYREGHPLPAMLPNSLRFDDALLQATSQPSMPYGKIASQTNTGFAQQAIPSTHPVMPQQSIQMQRTQQKSAVPLLEKHLVNQLSNEEQNSLNAKLKEATDADEKVQELEKEIMDSKEKIEFYRTKMQDLVLYKSRCDNKLNEITEKASSDRHEVDSLAKKYEDKYKQVAGAASKLTVEEANFRDIQERKLELYNAIVKMAQGGSADGLLQVRADRIQSDLEDLVKALNDRCKKYGLCTKPTTLIELPFGWQPGIPEGAADWDEDWDKFDDDGFMLVKELTVNVDNIKAPPKVKSSDASGAKSSKDDAVLTPTSEVGKVEKHSSTDDHVEGELADASEDASVRSPPTSPPGRSGPESPSEDFHPREFGPHDASFRHTTDHSDYGVVESSISDDNKFGDEASWGATFDSNDDVDSIWGLNTFDKENDHRSKKNSFDAGDFGLNPIRTGSPSSSSLFGKSHSSFFDESVPTTPFTSGPSPSYSDGFDHSFGSFGHFDSFNSQGQGNLARFDSISSNRGFDPSGFFSQPESLARFDSIRSTREADQNGGFLTFDDSEPFGSGPFKSSGSNASTPRRASDNWSAF